MNTPPPVPPIVPAPRRRGCLPGCAIGCFVGLLLAGTAVFFAVRFARGQFEAVMERFEREGYHRVQGQVIEITEPVDQPTIYIAQSVTLRAGSTRGLSFLCQTADLHGTVEGNVHFYGQTLTIHPDAHLLRDLHIVGQTARVYGRVDGEIKGSYQILEREAP